MKTFSRINKNTGEIEVDGWRAYTNTEAHNVLYRVWEGDTDKYNSDKIFGACTGLNYSGVDKITGEDLQHILDKCLKD